MNIHQLSKINLAPDVVDFIVFWTKNPSKMIDRLDELKDYQYYFQFTLNSYEKDIEPNVPSKSPELIETFKKLSDKIGADKVIWRYDPILLNNKYTIEYHIEYFEKIAQKLKNHTNKCTISFIDPYRHTTNNLKEFSLQSMTVEDKRRIAEEISKIAAQNNLIIDTCAEDIDLSDFNISHAKCIDDKLIEKIIGCKLNIERDKNQRLECGCVSSVDIGTYNTCKNACKYCYANSNQYAVQRNFKLHNPQSSFLVGEMKAGDTVKKAFQESYLNKQTKLF